MFGWNWTGRQRPDFAVVPDPGQESVWDYPRPPGIKPCSARIEVFSDQRPLACSQRSLKLMETASPPGYYLPVSDVDLSLLVDLPARSVCEWKGEAHYLALAMAPDRPVAWGYRRPRARFADLADHLAFYPARLDCRVDGERVTPQPGAFYGGWITSNIVGPFKGEPGTGHW